MARLPSVNKGSGIDDLARAFDPSRAAQAAAAAAVAQKNREETLKLQANNAADANFRRMIQSGQYTLSDLQAAASHNPALMAEIPKAYLAKIAADPNSSPRDRALAAQGAGIAYGSTEEGTHYVQGEENKRAVTAAGPGYAMANAARYGHDLKYASDQARLKQDEHHWFDEPKPQYDPLTDTVTYKGQGTLTSQGPSTSVPFSPEVFSGANKATPYSAAPNAPPLLARSADLNYALLHPEGRTIYAPTPPDVQVKGLEVKPAVAPGQTEAKLYTLPDIAANPGYFSEPPKDTTPPAPPSPDTLPAQAPWEAEQSLREWFNVGAGLTGQGFKLGDQGVAGPATLPTEIEQRMPELKDKVMAYATRNKLNFSDAARQVMQETYGTPGQGGFTINLPTYKSLWLATPTVQPGATLPARPTPTTPEGHPFVSPVPRGSTVRTAGPPVPPPPRPGAVAAPAPAPAPAPGYTAGGTAPLTFSLRGNPNPPPVPRVPPPAAVAPAAPAAAPAPAPAPAPAAIGHPPRPAGTDADLLAGAQAAIAAGKDPAAVYGRLRAWGVPVPGGQ